MVEGMQMELERKGWRRGCRWVEEEGEELGKELGDSLG